MIVRPLRWCATVTVTALAGALLAAPGGASSAATGDRPVANAATARLPEAAGKRIQVRMVAPRRAHRGERFTIRVETDNARKGQRAVILTRTPQTEQWVESGSGALNRRGVFQLRRTYKTGTSVSFKAVVEPGRGRRGGTSKPRTTQLRVWSTSIDALEVRGTLLKGGEFHNSYYWTPDLGTIAWEDMLDSVESADPSAMDSAVLGPSGPPEDTRILIASSRVIPADLLTPERYLQQLHVFNPFSGRIERVIDVGEGLYESQIEPDDVEFADGDGSVFAVTVTRGTYEDPVQTTLGIDMATGQTVWSTPGWLYPQTEAYGNRSTIAIRHEGNPSCTPIRLLSLETGAVVRTVADGAECLSALYDRGDLLYVDPHHSTAQLLWDATTGTPLTSVFTTEYRRWQLLTYDRAGGLLGGAQPDGTLLVARTDGTVVWSLDAERAAALDASVIRLRNDVAWVETTDQILRVDLVTADVTVAEPPTIAVAQIAGGYTLYSNGALRWDRF